MRKIIVAILSFLTVVILGFTICNASSISDLTLDSLAVEDKAQYRNKWVEIDGFYYYFNAEGEIVKDNWVLDSGEWYHVDETGKMQKSLWVHDANNDWYYVGSNGAMQKSNWVNNKYFVDEHGKMVKNGSYRIGNKAYSFDGNGVATEIQYETSTGNSNIKGNNTSGVKVYVTKKGKRYHSRPGCSNMKSPSAISENEAIRRGYSACSKCW